MAETKNRKKVFGVGVMDIKKPNNATYMLKKAYSAWTSMLSRCYNPSFQEKTPSYIGCVVCEEWKTFSSFYMWFLRNYIEGYHLDKDIIKKGNKIYCPEFCSFVPPEINYVVLTCKRRRGNMPIGVCLDKHKKKYQSGYTISKYGKHNFVYLGVFDTAAEAFDAYKTSKQQYLKTIAESYKETIDVRIYNALMNYKIEITD